MEHADSHYALLGVSPGVTQRHIERAYRRAISDLHDKIGRGQQASQEEFERLEAVFSVLRDPAKRAAYDRTISGPAMPPPAVPAEGPSSPDEGPRQLQFAFHGDGGEYFRIWIVNLLLSVLTLGIYSAWAKVRREQYFHRNLVLDDAGFEYHAKPASILRGRIVAACLFGGLSVSRHIGLAAYLVSLGVLAFVIPWMLMRAYRFRARNTSFRGLRFQFVGEYGAALKAFLGWGMLTFISCGLLFPLWLRAMHAYVIDNLRYGHGEFRLDASVGRIYGIVFLPVLGLIVFWALFGVLVGSAFGALISVGSVKHVDPKMVMLVFAVLYPVFLLLYVIIYACIRMALQNHFWSATFLDEHEFSCAMRLGGYCRIVLKNTLLTVLTLGLYWPWAKIALVGYRASRTSLTTYGGLDHYMAGASGDVSAVGDATADMFGFDIGF